MKYMLLILLLISFPAQAYDSYERTCNSKWQTIASVRENTVESSYLLTTQDLRLVTETYDQARKSFSEIESISMDRCKQTQVRILIVSEVALNSRLCFPNENDYAERGEILFGRCFREENTIVIVRPGLVEYPKWRSYFAHELAHQFFYDCGRVFNSDQEEHRYVNDYLTRAGYPLP
jgi:hypothetical protein